FLPNVSFHTKFKPFFEDYLPDKIDINKNIYKLLPDMEASATINSVYEKPDRNILLAIGPEGGWVPFEIDIMKSLGFKKFKLSDYTLRVEHALMASISQLELINAQ
ncbi:MAG: RsmE family RNA methyltransferase, partial [candidate division Zixibacteria bacterium]|nr:RsmE family RNA methyltransferase [candidate division Zixibacteria bacterium]